LRGGQNADRAGKMGLVLTFDIPRVEWLSSFDLGTSLDRIFSMDMALKPGN
jgi:hypothetical protein